MTKMPTVAGVTAALVEARNEVRVCSDTEDMEVRLQVYEDGSWTLRTGDSSYDQDHRGFWGASCVAPGDSVKFLRRIAKDLIDQAADSAAQSEV